MVEPMDIEMSPMPSFTVTLHSVEQPKNSFREVDNSSTVGMVDLTGRQVRGDSEGILKQRMTNISDYDHTYSAASVDHLNESLKIRAKRTFVGMWIELIGRVSGKILVAN